MAELHDRKDDGDSPLSNPVSKQSTEDRLGNSTEQSNKAFNNGLNQQRLDRKHTNVTLECNGVKFPAHNYVLACRSNYFFKMFSSPLLLPYHPTISLDEYHPKVVEVVLEFLYTDNINLHKIEDDQLEMLLECCRELEVSDFETQLLKVVIENLKPTNFRFALSLAEANKAGDVQAKVLSYVCQNLDTLWPNDDFVVLEEENFQEVLEKCSKTYPCHDVLLDSLLAWIKKDITSREDSLTRLMSHINFDKLTKKSASSLTCDSLVNSYTPLKTELIRISKRDSSKGSETTDSTTGTDVSLVGLNFEVEDPMLLFVGRNENNSATAVTYDVHNHQWYVPCDLERSLCHNPGIGYDSERIILVGGRDVNDGKLSSVTAYKLSNQTVEMLPDLRIARENPLVIAHEGIIYVIGGSGRYSSDGLTHGEYLSDINASGWKVLPPTRAKRSSLVTACVCGNYIYILGGGSFEVERFYIKKMAWEVLTPLPEEIFIDGIVFVANAGGQLWALKYFKPKEAYLYNHEANNWEVHNLKGKPPETITHSIGWQDHIYVLDRDMKLYILDATAKCWFEINKIPPKALCYPCFMGLL